MLRRRLEEVAGGRRLRPVLAPRSHVGREDRPTGLPIRWLEMMRRTLTTLGPKVLATRMVGDYVHQLYAPAAAAVRSLAGDGAGGLAAWPGELESGVVVRSLPGRDLVRASVGWWTSEEDLEQLLESL